LQTEDLLIKMPSQTLRQSNGFLLPVVASLLLSVLVLSSMMPSVDAGVSMRRRNLLSQSIIPLGNNMEVKVAEVELKEIADPSSAHCFRRSIITLGDLTVSNELNIDHEDLTALKAMPELKVYIVPGGAKRVAGEDIYRRPPDAWE
jgi:ureidoglycolate hydrolase